MNIIIWFIFCRHIKFSLSSKQYYDINYAIMCNYLSLIFQIYSEIKDFVRQFLICEFQY